MHKNFLKEELELKHNCHEGIGDYFGTSLFVEDDLKSNIRFMNYTVLPPGATIGNHEHGNDEEAYVVLSGSGIMYMDGEEFPVSPGSVTINKPYGTHGIQNTGDENMTLLVFEVAID